MLTKSFSLKTRIPREISMSFFHSKNVFVFAGSQGLLLIPFFSPELRFSFLPEDRILVCNTKNIAFISVFNSLINKFLFDTIYTSEVVLELRGLGFKISEFSGGLILNLGLSHDIIYVSSPKIITAFINDNTFKLKGVDYANLTTEASFLKKIKSLDSYKGTGIYIAGEPVLTKIIKKSNT